jgi:N-methylhydantoinase B/oxoprolinase/acetone carboxylase alpha subunit
MCNAGFLRCIEVKTKKGTMFDPDFPSPMAFYVEPMIGISDLMLRAVAENDVALIPAGDY